MHEAHDMEPMEEAKRVARRILTEVVGGGRFDLIDELVADTFVTEPPDGPPGPDGYRSWVEKLRAGFPDLTMEIEDQVGEGNKVATRFTAHATHNIEYLGVAPTGQRIQTRGVVIHEVTEGKISDFWLIQDDLGTLRQLRVAGENADPGLGTGTPDSDTLADLRRKTMEAYAAADVERAVALYVDGAVQQPPGRPPVVGREAIAQGYRLLFSRGGLALELTPWETVEAGTGAEARERGAYRLALGDYVLLVGKYLIVAAQLSDEWRYVWTTVAPD